MRLFRRSGDPKEPKAAETELVKAKAVEPVERIVRPERDDSAEWAEKIITPENAVSIMKEACERYKPELDAAATDLLVRGIQYREQHPHAKTELKDMSGYGRKSLVIVDDSVKFVIPKAMKTVLDRFNQIQHDSNRDAAKMGRAVAETLGDFIKARYGLYGSAWFDPISVNVSLSASPDSIRKLLQRLKEIEGFAVKDPGAVEKTLGEIERNYEDGMNRAHLGMIAHDLQDAREKIAHMLKEGKIPQEYVPWAKDEISRLEKKE